MPSTVPENESLAIEWWPTERVKPYPGNPRVIPESAISKVAEAIKAFKWRQPIVVDRQDVIIVGHTRRLAAIKLGLVKVPVHVADMTEAEAKAYRIADNRTGEEARWQPDILDLELKGLADSGFKLELTGLDPIELPGLTFAPIAEASVLRLDKKAEVKCPSCGHVFEPPAK